MLISTRIRGGGKNFDRFLAEEFYEIFSDLVNTLKSLQVLSNTTITHKGVYVEENFTVFTLNEEDYKKWIDPNLPFHWFRINNWVDGFGYKEREELYKYIESVKGEQHD